MKKVPADSEFLTLAISPSSPTSPILKLNNSSQNLLQKNTKKKHGESSIKQQILHSKRSDKVFLIDGVDIVKAPDVVSASETEEPELFKNSLKKEKLKGESKKDKLGESKKDKSAVSEAVAGSTREDEIPLQKVPYVASCEAESKSLVLKNPKKEKRKFDLDVCSDDVFVSASRADDIPLKKVKINK